MKPCICDECKFYHEGYCIMERFGCTAKSNDELITENEWERLQEKEVE